MTTDAVLDAGRSTGVQPNRLTGRLGPVAIVFMVVAAAAPLTVVAGTFPIGISAGNGAAYPASYVVCTAVLLLFAVGFTAMARHITGAGAFYTYIAHGFGRHAGLGAAFLALLSYTAVQVGVYGYIGASINELITAHGGPSVPWYLYALVMMAVTGFLGYRHIELSGKVLGVLLVCEVGIVLVINAAVIGHGGAQGLSAAVLHPDNFFSGAPGIALIFALAGYIGFEATAVFRDEARDPVRTIPRATYAALLLIGGFYALSSWALVSAWGDSGAVDEATKNPATMLTETATHYVGTVAGDLVQIFLITSLFAALLSFHNVLARYIFSLGNTRALPERCGRSPPAPRLPAHRLVRSDALGAGAGRGVGPRRAGAGDAGVHLVRRRRLGGHRGADDADVRGRRRLLPPDPPRYPAVAHRHRAEPRICRARGAVGDDRGEPAAAGRRLRHDGRHPRRPAGRRLRRRHRGRADAATCWSSRERKS